MRLADLRVGQRATYTRTVTARDIADFGALSGDHNPLHHDPAFAAKTRFGTPIAHGLLTGAFVSAVLGTRLPGPGAVYLSQSFRFLRPVRAGDTVTAAVEITAIRADKGIVTLQTVCRNSAGETVLDGEAVLLVEG